MHCVEQSDYIYIYMYKLIKHNYIQKQIVIHFSRQSNLMVVICT